MTTERPASSKLVRRVLIAVAVGIGAWVIALYGPSDGKARTTREGNTESGEPSAAAPAASRTVVKPSAPAPSTPCAACESGVHDGNHNCETTMSLCDKIKGSTTAVAADPEHGVPEMPGGLPYTEVCHRLLDCFHRTKCAGADGTKHTDCFCGVGVESNGCFAGTLAAATGPCKLEILAGVDSVQMEEISSRFTDNTFPAGVATQMAETCDGLYCKTECL